MTVHFDHLVKARYVKYQQLERFTYGPTGGRYSGNFTELEVYGYDTERFVQFIAEAQERLSSCDDGSAFAQSVYTDLQTLEAMLETGPVSTMNQLANMISDKLTMLENDSAPQAVPDKSALQDCWEKRSMKMSILNKAGTNMHRPWTMAARSIIMPARIRRLSTMHAHASKKLRPD